MIDQQSTIDALGQQLADSMLERTRLEAEVRGLREALRTIQIIGEGSTTANSLSNIARIAQKALGQEP